MSVMDGEWTDRLSLEEESWKLREAGWKPKEIGKRNEVVTWIAQDECEDP